MIHKKDLVTAKHNRFLLIIVMIFLCTSAFSQKNKYSTTSKGAINAFEDGTKYYDAGNFPEAIESFKKAINKDENFIEAYVVLAEVQARTGKYEDAILSYRKSTDINPRFFPNSFFQLAQLEIRTAKYEDALKDFENYQRLVPDLYAEKQEQLTLGMQSCKFAIDALKHPVPFNPINMGTAINSKEPEYFPSFTVDQNEIIFTRDVADKRAMEGHQEDFYFSSKKDTTWKTAFAPGEPLNSELNEGAPSISIDGKLLFFTACDRPGGQGSCDIYLSQRIDNGSWTKPINLGPPINTGAWETQPSFSSDGKTLYFIRGNARPGEGRNADIMMSTFQPDGRWSKPERLSNKINSWGNEESVFIHPDNQSLYFASDGRAGMGGTDIYMSRRQPDGSWGEAFNIGYPINTNGNENSIVVSADGKKAYFASDKAGGFGGLDLYSFDLYSEVQPYLVSYIKASVIDAETGLPLSAKFEIIEVSTGKIILSNSTDKKKGEFLATLPAGKNYMLNVNKEGYLFYSDYFECKDVTDRQHAYQLAIKLQKPKAGEKVVLKNIFFEVNKFSLKEESNTELNKLSAFLKSNPTIKIEIGGHTDNTGDKKANQVLSENRAKSVYDFLVKEGIPTSQLAYKGYGDAKHVASNNSEEGRAQNRRTEFTIL